MKPNPEVSCRPQVTTVGKGKKPALWPVSFQQDVRRGLRSTDLSPRVLLLWLCWVFCLENLHDLTPQNRDIIIIGRCPHTVPLYRGVCMHGNVTERNNIAPFHLRVRLTKGLRRRAAASPITVSFWRVAALWRSLLRNSDASSPSRNAYQWGRSCGISCWPRSRRAVWITKVCTGTSTKAGAPG
ncbi:hypothetical protein NKDENANG_03824 [Candidatus Entotheonellaceae bacterium PAL068K]